MDLNPRQACEPSASPELWRFVSHKRGGEDWKGEPTWVASPLPRRRIFRSPNCSRGSRRPKRDSPPQKRPRGSSSTEPNEIAEKKRSAGTRLPPLFLGTHPVDDRGGSGHLRSPAELGRPRHHQRAPGGERHREVVAGEQGEQRDRAAEEETGAHGEGAARREVGRPSRQGARPRRHRTPAPREHRSRRHKARRRRIPPDRRIGADRGIPARGEASGRRRLLLLDRPTGRDERARGHDGNEHLLRAHHEAGRGSAHQEPFPGGGGQDRRLSHRTRRSHGNDHVDRRSPPSAAAPRNPPVRTGPDRRSNPGGDAGSPLRLHDGGSIGAGEEGGHSQQAGRHRRDGRRRHPVRGQDGHDHEERADRRRSEDLQKIHGERRPALRGPRLEGGGQGPDRRRDHNESKDPGRGARLDIELQGLLLQAVRPRLKANRGHGGRQGRPRLSGHKGSASGGLVSRQ